MYDLALLGIFVREGQLSGSQGGFSLLTSESPAELLLLFVRLGKIGGESIT